MANPYRELFRPTGTVGFFSAALVARFPLGMLTLGIVIMLSDWRDSYGLPSLVASTAIGVNALVAPQLSRWADKYGQARIAIPASLFATTAFCVLIAASYFRWSDWSLFASAFCIGFMPNFGAFSRARWVHLYRGKPLLRTAFALESMGEELGWMSGPIIVVVLVHFFFPEVAVTATALLFLIGALSFSLQRGTQPPPQIEQFPKTAPAAYAATLSAPPKGERPMIFSAVVFFPSLTLFMLGSFFGVIEVTATAFAKQLELEYLTFVPLTAYAIGSFLTGIGYGALHWRLALPRQFLLMSALVVLTSLPFFFVTSLSLLSLICLLAGLAYSPTVIIAMGLIEELSPKERLTESMTWALIAPIIGIASGIALSGEMIDRYGAQVAFYSTVLFGVLAFLIVLVAQRSLKVKK